MWKHLLLYKWILYNMVGLIFAFAFFNIIENALSYDMIATPFILGVYVIFLIIGSYRIVLITKSINNLKSGILSANLVKHEESLKYHFFSKISILEFLAETPISIGILGTVIGLILISMGLSEVLSGLENANQALDIFGQFISGALIAFISTAAGIAMERWLSFLMVIIRNGVGEQMQLAIELQRKINEST